MRDRAGRREIGFAIALLRRHARGDRLNLFEPVDPEALVEIEIAVIALRGAIIGAEEIDGRLL